MVKSFFQTNLQALRQRHPTLAARFENEPSPDSVTVQTTPSGTPTLEVPAASGRTVLYHSRNDPRKEAERWANAPENRESSRIVLFGLGLGYQALALLSTARRDYLCVFEPRADVFRAALEHVDLRPLFNNAAVDLICAEPAHALYQTLFRRMGEFLSTGFHFQALPAATQVCPNELQEVQHEISRLAEAGKNMLAHMESTGYHTQEHILRNVPKLYRSVPPSSVKNLLSGNPALIVAAGPSLDKNIDLIPDITGRAAVFACDTSFQLLRRKGVEPQFVVTKDPSELNARHFEGIDDLGRTVFVFDPQITPALANRFRNPSIFLPHRCRGLHEQLPGRELKQEDILPFSQNVALAAFHLARVMGCTPIIFVGLDLAFPPQGKSHASGSALQAEVMRTSTGKIDYRRPEADGDFHEEVDSISVASVDGTTVSTSAAFFESIRYLENLLAETEVHCIDATEGGAWIQGTQILSLRETIDTYLTVSFNPWQVVERISTIPTPAIPEGLFEDLATVVERVGSHAKKQLGAVSSLSGDMQPEQLSRLLQEFRAVREQIEEGFRLYQILELALERLFVTIRAPDYFTFHPNPASQVELLRRYVHYFSEIHKACTVFGEMLHNPARDAQNHHE